MTERAIPPTAAAHNEEHVNSTRSDDAELIGTATLTTGERVALSRAECEAILAAADAAKHKRAESMPTVQDALVVMSEAYRRLHDLGWREAMYCPKDGSRFEVIEAGSSGIHVAHYNGKWPNGWWIADAGDLWPSHPILWRPIQKGPT